MNNECLVHASSVVLAHGLYDALQKVFRNLSQTYVVAVDNDCPILYLSREEAVSNDEVDLKVC